MNWSSHSVAVSHRYGSMFITYDCSMPDYLQLLTMQLELVRHATCDFLLRSYEFFSKWFRDPFYCILYMLTSWWKHIFGDNNVKPYNSVIILMKMIMIPYEGKLQVPWKIIWVVHLVESGVKHLSLFLRFADMPFKEWHTASLLK